MVIVREQSWTVREQVLFSKGRVAAFKGVFNVLNNNILVLFLDIIKQDKLKELVRVFDINYLA